MNAGSSPRRTHEGTHPRVKASDDAKSDGSQPKRDSPARKPRRKQEHPPKAGNPETANLNPKVHEQAPTSRPTLKPSPAPQTPIRVDFGSTDFTSLFGVSASLSDVPPSTITKTIAADAVSRRAQLALEYHGGDYSKLVPNTFATGPGDPLVYAASTLARRRDIGPNRRSNALEIIRGMVEKSLGPQPTS